MSSLRTLWSFNVTDADSDIIGSMELCIAFKDISTAEFAVYSGISIFPKDLRDIIISMVDDLVWDSAWLVPIFDLTFVEYVHDDSTITQYEGDYLLTAELEGKSDLFFDIDSNSDSDSETELVSSSDEGYAINFDDE